MMKLFSIPVVGIVLSYSSRICEQPLKQTSPSPILNQKRHENVYYNNSNGNETRQ
jgi:hypothetical protein